MIPPTESKILAHELVLAVLSEPIQFILDILDDTRTNAYSFGQGRLKLYRTGSRAAATRADLARLALLKHGASER